ncbi:uncharacterized protein CTRU02_201766 [Colletotrichum truncatum]|uniref:Uncharacterized protein n=1 Tax=Colletotrichum truncatum TaxID=5467 RepID=A0ACC3ZID8_COLTU|nr:uncharacterized protein CTRU02_11653 [Colletotrichum truncatum]KAF6785668.1 hypothetical protein CTRU02_11653 [Colletotrichum truncatum]
MSLGQITSSAFITCDPIPVTVPTTVTTTQFTTIYTTTALAANPTTTWTATYTVTEVCPGAPCQPHAIPPCFVPTTILCLPCAEKTIPIICPAPTLLPGVTIHGNGVTADAMPTAPAAYGAYGAYGGGANPSGAAPGYGVYGGYGDYKNGQPVQSGVPVGPGQQPGQQPTQPPAGKPTVVTASAPSLKKSLGLLCGVAMAAGLTVLA